MASGRMLAGAVFCMVLVLGGSAAAQAKLLSDAASDSQGDGLPVNRRLLMSSWTSTAAPGTDPSMTPGRILLKHSGISTPSSAATTQQQQQQVRRRSLLQDGDADGSADDEVGERSDFSHNDHKHDTISRRLEKVGWPLGMHVHHTASHPTRL